MGWLDVRGRAICDSTQTVGRCLLLSRPLKPPSLRARSWHESRRGFALQPTILSRASAHRWRPSCLRRTQRRRSKRTLPIQLLADGSLERRPLLIAQGGANDWMTPTTLHARPLVRMAASPEAAPCAGGHQSAPEHETPVSFRPVELIQQGLAGQARRRAYLAPLRARLTDYGLATDQILVATVFTTADPLEEFCLLSDAQRALPTPALSAPGRRPSRRRRVYEAEYRAPLWQHGAKPYASEGGGFVFEGDAPVQATSDEVMRLAISIPQGEPPERGLAGRHLPSRHWRQLPLIPREPQGRLPKTLNRQGLAMIGLDQPLHGLRAVAGTNTEWHTSASPISKRAPPT